MSTLPGTTGRRRIYLMRHGHVDYFSDDVRRTGNIRDVPLTPLGRDEAEDGALTPEIERVLIKAINLTLYNWLKAGMNRTSVEAIVLRD